MGIALAMAAVDYGAEVELVIGPVSSLPCDKSVKVIPVTTAEEMAAECISRFRRCDIAILAAAVADYTPVRVADSKIKRTGDELILKLKPTQDIAAALGKQKKDSQVLAGFALETDNEIENATHKLRQKNFDIIVLNSLRDKGAGFGSDTNVITIIDRNNNIDKFELKSKDDAASDILDKIVSTLKRKSE
jgi:phosphopantothenoylcysteine decarboxylase / phosphopantothenate---cysteine ligase